MKHCHVTTNTGASRGRLQRNIAFGLAAVALSIFLSPQRAGAGLVLEDTLQGSTTGARYGGAFVAGGWKVTVAPAVRGSTSGRTSMGIAEVPRSSSVATRTPTGQPTSATQSRSSASSSSAAA